MKKGKYQKYIEVIKNMNSGAISSIRRSNGKVSKTSPITMGVHQQLALSLNLFCNDVYKKKN